MIFEYCAGPISNAQIVLAAAAAPQRSSGRFVEEEHLCVHTYFPSSCCSVAYMGGAKQDWEAIGYYSHTLPTMEKREKAAGLQAHCAEGPLILQLDKDAKGLVRYCTSM